MDDIIDKLGIIVRTARLQAGISRKEHAKKLSISPHHLGAIENNQKKPGYVLFVYLIRELHIPTDRIFYPESAHERPDLDLAFRLLRRCSEKDVDITTAMLYAMLRYS